MKTISIPVEGLSLESLLSDAQSEQVVFLTANGQVQFALMPCDDGDREVFALRANQDFLDYLSEAEQRARSQPRKSLAEMRNRCAEE